MAAWRWAVARLRAVSSVVSMALVLVIMTMTMAVSVVVVMAVSVPVEPFVKVRQDARLRRNNIVHWWRPVVEKSNVMNRINSMDCPLLSLMK